MLSSSESVNNVTAATNAEIPATIHPNTGIDLIAEATARNDAAKDQLATVPVPAATAFAPVATVFAPVATVEPAAAADLALCEAAFAVLAAVFAVVAVVSAVSSTTDCPVSLFHYSFNEFKVTSVNAESLFKVAETCCNPIVIDIKD